MIHTMNDVAPHASRLSLPMQAAPVQRADAPGTGSVALGVEADFDFGDILGTIGDVVKVGAPILGGLLGI
jgi:hypothetical protein